MGLKVSFGAIDPFTFSASGKIPRLSTVGGYYVINLWGIRANVRFHTYNLAGTWKFVSTLQKMGSTKMKIAEIEECFIDRQVIKE
jgi:hypothetical protein